MAPDRQERRRIVVDGSNIATEGRSVPSLAQLDEAIRSFLEEYQGFVSTDVTVVVDATFGHRIDPSEVAAFDQAVEHGEMITPPAGAVGRGDGFILRIAEKSGALVLSNDSFQEFHAERPWLFEPGRLIGGKPVPGVGWVFTPRSPVRGAKSRTSAARSRRDGSVADGTEDGDEPAKVAKAAKATKATKATKAAKPAKATKTTKTEKPTKATKATKAAKPAKATKTTKTEKPAKATKTAKPAKTTKAATKAKSNKAATKAKATEEPKAAKPSKTTKPSKAAKSTKAANDTKTAKPAKTTKAASTSGGAGAPAALNDPVTFLQFVADHPVGSTFDATVASFTSHGAHIEVDGMLCHVPLRRLSDPPPSRARQVLTKGETRPFVLVSLDVARRRAEVALPGLEGD